jgi:uncharacterized membrane protein
VRPPRDVLRWVLGLLYLTAGYFHLATPGPFLEIIPAWVPAPEFVVRWTGLSEIAGSIALLQPWSKRARQAGAIALGIYAICVFPANINHLALDLARADGGFGLAYHIPRLAFQPVLVWLALWTGGVTNWPFAGRPSDKDR